MALAFRLSVRREVTSGAEAATAESFSPLCATAAEKALPGGRFAPGLQVKEIDGALQVLREHVQLCIGQRDHHRLSGAMFYLCA